MSIDTITVDGVVATDLRQARTGDGLAITSFRLASAQRRYDARRGEWTDTGTNWFTVTAFRGLAENVARSLSKGQRVLVRGRLRVNEWRSDDGRSGLTVEILADSLGHDLAWGRSMFERISRGGQSGAAGGERPAATVEEHASDAGPSDGAATGVTAGPGGDGVAPVSAATPESGRTVAGTAIPSPAPGASPSGDGDDTPRAMGMTAGTDRTDAASPGSEWAGDGGTWQETDRVASAPTPF